MQTFYQIVLYVCMPVDDAEQVACMSVAYIVWSSQLQWGLLQFRDLHAPCMVSVRRHISVNRSFQEFACSLHGQFAQTYLSKSVSSGISLFLAWSVCTGISQFISQFSDVIVPCMVSLHRRISVYQSVQRFSCSLHGQFSTDTSQEISQFRDLPVPCMHALCVSTHLSNFESQV